MADVADLSFGDEIVQGRQCLLDRRHRVGRVQLVQVDPVGLQAAQRRLDGQADVPARAADSPVRPVRAAHVHSELGREHDGVALTRERLAHQCLGQPSLRTVDVRRVEQRHPGVDGGPDHGIRAFLALRCGSLPAEVVAAEADGGDDESGFSEGAVFDLSHDPRLAARRGRVSRREGSPGRPGPESRRAGGPCSRSPARSRPGRSARSRPHVLPA